MKYFAALAAASSVLLVYPMLIPTGDLSFISPLYPPLKTLLVGGVVLITAVAFVLADHEPTVSQHMHVLTRAATLAGVAAVFVALAYGTAIIALTRLVYNIWPEASRLPSILLSTVLVHFVCCAPGAALYALSSRSDPPR